MHVRFSDVDVHYIKGKVESGFYTSENEVVRDAVRRMREEEERIAQFQAAVRIGDEQIERGETVPYGRELMEQIGQRAVQRAKQGQKIDSPDVRCSPASTLKKVNPPNRVRLPHHTHRRIALGGNPEIGANRAQSRVPSLETHAAW